MEAKVDRALKNYKPEEDNKTISSIREMFVGDELCKDVTKTLVLFSYENLVPDIVVAVVEELVLDDKYKSFEVVVTNSILVRIQAFTSTSLLLALVYY